eukprot:m.57299 g.57299  ORF g.57299 m.57299 type:complete len:109 (+) comp11221_c1_seq4:902-1228(+)
MIKLISVPCFYLMELDLGRDFGTDMDVDFELFVVDESGCVYSSATSSIVFERFPAESCFQLFFPFLSFTTARSWLLLLFLKMEEKNFRRPLDEECLLLSLRSIMGESG